MTEAEKVTKVSDHHERFDLGESTAKFFEMMHALWAEGKGSQLLKTQFVKMAASESSLAAVEPMAMQSVDVDVATENNAEIATGQKMTIKELLQSIREKVAAGLSILSAEPVTIASKKSESESQNTERKHPFKDFIANLDKNLALTFRSLQLTPQRV